MGKDLKGKELGKGIVQKKTGRYEARFTNRFGKRVTILGDNLREVKKKLNEAIYEDEKEINIRENIKLKDGLNTGFKPSFIYLPIFLQRRFP